MIYPHVAAKVGIKLDAEKVAQSFWVLVGRPSAVEVARKAIACRTTAAFDWRRVKVFEAAAGTLLKFYLKKFHSIPNRSVKSR